MRTLRATARYDDMVRTYGMAVRGRIGRYHAKHLHISTACVRSLAAPNGGSRALPRITCMIYAPEPPNAASGRLGIDVSSVATCAASLPFMRRWPAGTA